MSRLRVSMMLVVLAGTVPVFVASPASGSVSCSTEYHKFVEDWSGGSPVYAKGVMSDMYAYDRNYNTCGDNYNSVHVGIDATGGDYAEAGTFQTDDQGGTHAEYFRPFCEYQIGGGNAVRYLENRQISSSRWVTFDVRVVTGGSFDFHFECKVSTDGGATWDTYYTTPQLTDNTGLALSESSHHGDFDDIAYVTNLNWMQMNGYWANWTGIHCGDAGAGYGSDSPGYDAQVISATAWQNVHTAQVGNC